ncbi:MAG: antibiotic biosynthesis monooxygenase [Polyangiaceae bacterium]
MLIVHVEIQVKPEGIEAFKEATLANARGSVKEAGVLRFDVIQQADDPTRFVLVEVYRDEQAPALHKETAHYLAWRKVADPIMAVTRTSRKFTALFPEQGRWAMPPEAE